MPILLAVAALLLTLPALAEMPNLDDLKQRRYVIRKASGSTSDDLIFLREGGAGIWEWNYETGEWVRLRPLVYGQYLTGNGAGMAGMQDRIVVQGSTFLEFDAATNRLLRQYRALPRLPDWAFRGPLVTEQLSATLGIAAGYYGYPNCPPTNFTSPHCSSALFPGYDSPTTLRVRADILHRREPTPASADLSVTTTSPQGVFDDRYLALDADRSRFWFRDFSAETITNRFGYLPIENGVIGDEVVVDVDAQTPGQVWRRPEMLFYDRISDTLLTRWQPSRGDAYITGTSGDPSSPEEVIATGAHLPYAMTTLAPGLPETYEQVLPGIGKAPGASGTSWRSDAWFFNPSGQPTTFSVRRVSRPDVTMQIDLPARGSRAISDVLGVLGGGPAAIAGDGVTTDALVIESPYRWGEQLTVYSRTYTTAADGKGTLGQSVPAVPSREGYSTHLPSFQIPFDVRQNPPEFALDLRQPGRFRHNLGVVNDSAEPLPVDVSAGGAIRTFTVAPHSVANVNLETLLTAEIIAKDPAAVRLAIPRPLPVWLSMVDNRTGDATFLPYMMFDIYGALDATMAIPQIANATGANGTRWRSDLYGSFAGPPFSGAAKAYFYPAGATACGAAQRGETTIARAPERATSRVYPNLVTQFASCVADETTGALEMHAGSWMAGFSRTYTTREDGGTFGDILPFYPGGGWPVQHFSGVTVNEDFRINVGFYNGLDYNVVHRLIVYDAAGNEVRRHDLPLDARRSLQAPLVALLGDLAPGLYGLSVIPLDSDDGPGRSWAYVSIVDNATGDPTNLW